MRRRQSVWLLLLASLFLCVPSALAGNALSEAERKEAKGGMDNLKQAVSLYAKAGEENPQSYEAFWKGARTCRKVAKQAKQQKVKGWEDICAEYGKRGMELAKQAIELKPKGVEGHYYYGVCVGSYSDGVSIFTALGEGLKGKTKTHLKKAYELDKRFNDGTPAMALGRFYEVLPWLAGQDKDKALKYYREALQLMPEDSEYRPELHVFAGRLMLDQGVEREKAKQLLRSARDSDDAYCSKKAEEILKEYS